MASSLYLLSLSLHGVPSYNYWMFKGIPLLFLIKVLSLILINWIGVYTIMCINVNQVPSLQGVWVCNFSTIPRSISIRGVGLEFWHNLGVFLSRISYSKAVEFPTARPSNFLRKGHQISYNKAIEIPYDISIEKPTH